MIKKLTQRLILMKIIFIMYLSNAFLNLDKQMTNPFNISTKFEIMGYEKLKKTFIVEKWYF
jgi:hypothetical protein